MIYQEIRKDLFKADSSYALAHCISRDCEMGAGIAKDFNKRFPEMKKYIKGERPKIGETIGYQSNQWLIFNLITKERYWHKPTYETFRIAIEDLNAEVLSLKVEKLAIPLLGAGLDKLDWSKNRGIIKEVFADTNIEILVCIK